MSETKDNNDRPTGDRPTGQRPLSAGRPQGGGTVRQNFSHGRSNAVVVEKKKRRRVQENEKSGAGGEEKKLTPAQIVAKKFGISVEEAERRIAALRAATAAKAEVAKKKEADEEARKKREEADRRRSQEGRALADATDAKRREEEEAKRREAEAAEERKRERAGGAAASAPSKAREASARPAAGGAAEAKPRSTPADRAAAEVGLAREEKGPRRIRDDVPAETGRGARGKKGAAAPAPGRVRTADDSRRRQRLTIATATVEDGGERQRSLASVRRAREKEKQRRMMGGTEREKVVRDVVIPEVITVGDLANRMTERAADVIKFLMAQGQMVRTNDPLDADTAELIVEEFGHRVKRVSEADIEEGFLNEVDEDENQLPRAPVVAVMGHVDHGKTSLLDALRSANVASGEAGGITQHIGAYQVQTPSGDTVTFLDTPGHAAFSAMRLRGANVTDLVILVVAADDGVKPQTIEAINHARAAGTPIIVAVNKMDKPDAKPQKVLEDLLRHEVVVESMGGETQVVEVSALKKTGLDALLEAINLQAELLELKANPDRSAEGVVIESQLDKGRGPVATVLVKRGALQRGDIVVAGTAWGKVRALINERGQQMKSAGPSAPAEVLGLDGPPDPGEPFAVVETEARARELTEYRARKKREKIGVVPTAAASLEQMMSRLKDQSVSEAAVLVKADVQGSGEAIAQALEGLGNEEVQARVIHQAVGGINESDVTLAKASNAPIIAFNVRASKQARELAEREGVEIRYYSIIYDLIEDMTATLNGMLAPEKREDFIGYAEILEVFNISKVGKVAGCRITEGVVKRGCGVRLLREDVVIHEGSLKTLKRFKDEVPEVKAGLECGMAFERYEDIRKGDLIECFTVTMVERTLESVAAKSG